MRSRSGQPCSPSRAVDFCVLRPARHTLVCLRGRVLHKSPHPRRFRPARPYETAVLFQNLVSVGFPLGLRPRPSKRCAFFGGYAAPIVTALATLVEFGAARGIPRGPAFLVVAPARLRPAPTYSARHLRRDASSAGYHLPSLACTWRRNPRTAVCRLAQLLLVSPPTPQ